MYSAKIIKDSINESGNRLTTFELEYPRFVHSELMTHRKFCLAGDMEIEFDLPMGTTATGSRRIYTMRLDVFVDKWINGARRIGSKPKRESDLSWIVPGDLYSARTAAYSLGMAHASNINKVCRDGVIPATKKGREWFIRGSDLKAWRLSTPTENRFNILDKLKAMQIRQLNETTGDIQTSYVVNACMSGVKDVYEVSAGGFKVAGSLSHRIKTPTGYTTIKELSIGDEILVRRFGKREVDKLDPTRHKKIGGRWRSSWQTEQRAIMQSENPLCRTCNDEQGQEVHHVVPVYEDPSMAFTESNITLLCRGCHESAHETQGWQGGTYLYGDTVTVDSIRFRGKEQTFDLEIAGEYPNFIANGVVVHNSRNSASSRALPTKKLLEQIENDPVIPKFWGKNQSGMQAREELTGVALEFAQKQWLLSRDMAVQGARQMHGLGMHKQLANRVLEPWMFITVIVSATEYENWFHLRDSEFAQPEIAWVAREMRRLYNEGEPVELSVGDTHLPYVELSDHKSPLYVNMSRLCNDFEVSDIGASALLKKISVARCARVSYLTHDGKRDYAKDIELHDKCRDMGHWSAFEHVATAMNSSKASGNFTGWQQYRKGFENESGVGGTK